jgi:hypothetical protein
MARPGSSGVEQRIENPRVGGSIPPPGTIQVSSDVRGPPSTSIKTRLQGGASSAFVRQKSLEDIFSAGIETAGNLTGRKNAPDRQTYPRRAKSSQ